MAGTAFAGTKSELISKAIGLRRRPVRNHITIHAKGDQQSWVSGFRLGTGCKFGCDEPPGLGEGLPSGDCEDGSGV